MSLRHVDDMVTGVSRVNRKLGRVKGQVDSLIGKVDEAKKDPERFFIYLLYFMLAAIFVLIGAIFVVLCK